MNTYAVKLQDFEGPLDLMLFFIKRDELDIYDIPIARITKEFFEYIHYMQQLDLEIAGEFLVMAAELMQIKVRLLLPPEAGAGQSEEDPRAQLIKRLVEYKRFK
ncbi:MAG: segregation/condensation protein A, partial [Bacteroidota bacterium]